VDRVAPLLLVAAALPMRLANIGSYSGKADEGTRAEQLLLMAAGFRPVKDIFASQGPLSLDVFYPFFIMLDRTLAGARLAVVAYSLVELLAVFWLGRLAGGRVGGWAAGLLLLASPTFLKNSRLALVEVPAILPATLALAAGIAYARSTRRRWLVLSAVALALALSIKPMVAAVVPAIGLALLLRRGATHASLARDLLGYAAVCGGLLAAIVLAVGPAELYDQLVRYRVGSREAEGWGLASNWSMLWGELQWDQPAFYALALVGGILLVPARPREGLPLVLWAGLSFGLLLAYSPLGTKHAVLQIPPTAALAGAGLGVAWSLVRARGRAERGVWARTGGTHAEQGGTPGADDAGADEARTVSRAPGRWPGMGSGVTAPRLAAGACGLALVGYLLSVPAVVARDRQAMSAGDLGAEAPYRQESALIQALTAPDDFILVDDAYLAYLNRRLMPPKLVDTSIFLIRSGALSGADVVEQTEAFDVRLMLLVSDNLRELKKFRDWADERFAVVKIDERSNRKDRSLYLRRDEDLEGARAAVRGAIPGLGNVNGELAGQVRVRGYALDDDDLRAGATTMLTVEWEASAPIAVDWRQVTFLSNREGQVVEQTERSLGGGSGGTSTWAPGRWVFRSAGLTIPPRTPPGEYTVGVGLYDSKARTMAATATGGEEVRLGPIRVR